MGNECCMCMAFDADDYKEGTFTTYYWCKRFQCWRRWHQPACDAFVADNYCFLTTACVQYRGLADDCKELTVLRAFRDGFLKTTEEGRALVEEYYRIAPQIVAKIELRADRGEIYGGIYTEVLRCVELIEQGKYRETTDTYTAMVRRLEQML